MKIEGTYTFQAPAEEVWNCLLDQQSIQHDFPGLERLTAIDKQTYSFAIHLRHAPLRGSYTGKTTIIANNYPSSYHLRIEGEGQSRTFLSECDIQISSHDANTIVSYQCTIQLGRSGSLIPAQLVRATVKVLLQQFFTGLAEQLRTTVEGPIYVTTLEEMYEMPFMEEQRSEDLMPGNQFEAPTVLHRLIRFVGLGQHDAAAEELWVQRLRRGGTIAILLLLVWVGTRLPRRLTSHP